MVLLGRDGWGSPRLRARAVAAAATLAILVVGCAAPAEDGSPTASTAAVPSVSSSLSITDTGSSSAGTSPPTATSTSSATSTPTTTPKPTATPTAADVSVVLGPVGLDGVNDVSCVSSQPPVVLLHGTLSTIAVDYPVLVPALLAAGRCVFGADDGRHGLGAVRDSAAQAAAVIRQVLALTGAATVDAVGFSQGGLVLRTALRLDGVADLVSTAALISPSFHGTTSPLVSAVPAAVCPACTDLAAGSALLTELDAGGDLDGAVRYAVAVTSTDAVVTPWQSQLPSGPPERVRSVVIDRQCPGPAVRHEDMSRRPSVVGWVVAALGAQGDVEPADLQC